MTQSKPSHSRSNGGPDSQATTDSEARSLSPCGYLTSSASVLFNRSMFDILLNIKSSFDVNQFFFVSGQRARRPLSSYNSRRWDRVTIRGVGIAALGSGPLPPGPDQNDVGSGSYHHRVRVRTAGVTLISASVPSLVT